jgi:hypothetical protein
MMSIPKNTATSNTKKDTKNTATNRRDMVNNFKCLIVDGVCEQPKTITIPANVTDHREIPTYVSDNIDKSAPSYETKFGTIVVTKNSTNTDTRLQSLIKHLITNCGTSVDTNSTIPVPATNFIVLGRNRKGKTISMSKQTMKSLNEEFHKWAIANNIVLAVRPSKDSRKPRLLKAREIFAKELYNKNKDNITRSDYFTARKEAYRLWSEMSPSNKLIYEQQEIIHVKEFNLKMADFKQKHPEVPCLKDYVTKPRLVYTGQIRELNKNKSQGQDTSDVRNESVTTTTTTYIPWSTLTEEQQLPYVVQASQNEKRYADAVVDYIKRCDTLGIDGRSIIQRINTNDFVKKQQKISKRKSIPVEDGGGTDETIDNSGEPILEQSNSKRIKVSTSSKGEVQELKPTKIRNGVLVEEKKGKEKKVKKVSNLQLAD